MHANCTLAYLLEPWLKAVDNKIANISISELELDSRAISEGTTFVAVRGHSVDGRRFISGAIKSGANAVIAESDEDYPHGTLLWIENTPVIYLDSLGSRLSALAGRLYE